MVTRLCAILADLVTVYVLEHTQLQYITRDASAGSMHNSRVVVGDSSVHTYDVLRAGGLVPARMPVADFLLAMSIIAGSAISVLNRAPLLSGGNFVRISTYVFWSTSSYLLVSQEGGPPPIRQALNRGAF